MVGQSAVLSPDFSKAKLAAINIFKIIDRKPLRKNAAHEDDTIPDSVKIEQNNRKLEGNISFRGVYFHYPNRSELSILNGLSFGAQKGETIGLVGESGCGKSTTIQLLEQFYEPVKGKIVSTFLYIKIKQVNLNILFCFSISMVKKFRALKWTGFGKFLQFCIKLLHLSFIFFRSQMALVQQEPILFSYSIRENIAYGDNARENIPFDEIVRVAKMANIHDFIEQLPKGYETLVGSKGNQLSGNLLLLLLIIFFTKQTNIRWSKTENSYSSFINS